MLGGKNVKNVVVTGVSSGIGLATTRRLLELGYYVFGSVRREEDAARLQAELGERFTPLLFDVTDPAAVERAVRLVGETVNSAGIVGLINGAGYLLFGPVEHLSLNEARQQLEVNFLGPLTVTNAFLPLLRQAVRLGNPVVRVINVSSSSADAGYPFFGLYVASKLALEGLTASWRRELMADHIDLVVVVPGSVQTDIWEKARDARHAERFAGTRYAESLRRMVETMVRLENAGMTPDYVARSIVDTLEAQRPRTRRSIFRRRLLGLLPRLVPPRLMDRLLGRQLRLG